MFAGHDGRLNFTILLSKHAKLRGHIILSRSRSTIKSGTTSTETSKLHVELVKWWNEVEECFDVEHDTRGSAMTPYQRTVLSVLRYESIIALSRDVIGNSQMDSEYSAALQNCITAARSIINSLHTFLVENSADSDSRLQCPLSWPSFTWAIWMSAFILLHAASEDQLADAAANRYTTQDGHRRDAAKPFTDYSTAVSRSSST